MFAILEEPENAYYHSEDYVEFTLVATGADAYLDIVKNWVEKNENIE